MVGGLKVEDISMFKWFVGSSLSDFGGLRLDFIVIMGEMSLWWFVCVDGEVFSV